MRFRKLRITWSVLWGLACVLLIALWVRSYWWWDFGFSGNLGDESITIAIIDGELCLHRQPNRGYKPHRIFPQPLEPSNAPALANNRNAYTSMLGVGWRRFGLFGYYAGWQGSVSLWWPILISIAAVTLPWLPWKFKLRTLLIATTLVAVVLGLAVWTVR